MIGGDARKIQLQLIVKSWEMSDKELMNAKQRAAGCQWFALQTQRLTMTTCKFRFDSGLKGPRSIQISRQKSV